MSNLKKTCGIFFISNDGLLLIGRATNSENWSIPKGLKEERETDLECAMREFFEETSLKIDSPIKYVGDFEYRNKAKKLVSFITFSNKDSKKYKPICNSLIDNSDQPELDKFQWVDFKTAKKMIHSSQVDALNKIRSFCK